MQYSNPKIPEGINTSEEHPLREFFWLTGGVLASLFAIVLLLIVFVDILTSYIPFSMEKEVSLPGVEIGTTEGPLPEYLQSLANRLIEVEALPDEMQIVVHYVDDGTVNAFATLGGHVFFFRGLLEKIPHENALMMLIAHEVAHVKHRHPIKSLGRGLIAGLVLSVISATAGDVIIENFLGEAGYLTILKYSREMETEADKTAINAVISIYGHAHGAGDLFKILQGASGDLGAPEFFSSHPLTENRISETNNVIIEVDSLQDKKTISLPSDFKIWLEVAPSSDEK